MDSDEIQARITQAATEMQEQVVERSLDLVKTLGMATGITMTEDEEWLAKTAIGAAYIQTVLVFQERGLLPGGDATPNLPTPTDGTV